MPGDAERALALGALRRPGCTFVMIWLRRRSIALPCFRTGGASFLVMVMAMQTVKVWDVATGKCVATLEGHSRYVRCGVHCTFVMIVSSS